MAVQIARPSDMMMRDPMQGPQYRPNPTQQQKPEPSVMQQFGQMAQERAMTSALDKGAGIVDEKVMAPAGEALTGMFSSAPTQAAIDAGATTGAEMLGSMATTGAGAGTGALATIGTAVPYIGAGLLAGKALGLFSNGGHVGPLYAADGTRGVEQQLKTGKRQDMSKGPIGLLDMFVKGVDTLTGYDRKNEKRADLPEGKVDPEAIQLGHGGMAGPLSKIEYKSAGGETYKLSYGGPISKGA